MLGPMRIERFTPDDHAANAAAVELTNTVNKVDAPFEHPVTVDAFVGLHRYGWDGEAPEMFGAWEGETLAGRISLYTSERDNTHVAWCQLLVHPDLRGTGRGSELLAFAEERTVQRGRTSIGCFGWDAPRTHRFAARHGLPPKGSAVLRRQVLDRVEPAVLAELYDDARAAATSYELLRLAGPLPEELVAPVADMAASINDAPTDDLDIEDEVYSPERVRSYEQAQLAQGKRLYRVVARHRDTGDLAGHTVVAVDGERPWIGDQHDTTVVAAHRGHRLGLLLKTEMLRWLAVEEPGLATIDTWNMASNDFMIAVNERLGYEVLGREIQFQRDAR